MSDVNATEKYKDRLFCYIFGSEEHKDWSLSLYNAVNGTSYSEPDMISIETLTQVLYMGMHDDVALMLMDELNLYEHQATFNPNLPLRMLQYIANIFEVLITLQKKNKYGSKLILLPVPKLFSFYNGTTDKPEEMVLNLSDSFPEDKRAESDIQVRVRMININPGKNPDLVKKCRPLEEYIWTVAAIRENRKQMNIEESIDKALNDMPKDFEIRPFLMANRVGVKKMLLTEYNEAETMALFKEEGREEGLKEGIEIGIEKGREEGIEKGVQKGITKATLENIQNLMETLKFSAKEAMDALKITSEDQKEYASQL